MEFHNITTIIQQRKRQKGFLVRCRVSVFLGFKANIDCPQMYASLKSFTVFCFTAVSIKPLSHLSPIVLRNSSFTRPSLLSLVHSNCCHVSSIFYLEPSSLVRSNSKTATLKLTYRCGPKPDRPPKLTKKI